MLTATKSSRIDISEEKKTKSIAKIFSKNIKSGNILFFKGELGVGKTTFIKYLINFIQIANNQPITEVPSPTFNLVNEYQIEKLILKHYDLYRINNEKELSSIGIFEDNSEQITLIEWPEIIKNNKIKKKIVLHFEYDENYNNRFLTISSSEKIRFLDEFK
jgi:tRNA threonylcarbamoyl adenosine modification protein YjeE